MGCFDRLGMASFLLLDVFDVRGDRKTIRVFS